MLDENPDLSIRGVLALLRSKDTELEQFLFPKPVTRPVPDPEAFNPLRVTGKIAILQDRLFHFLESPKATEEDDYELLRFYGRIAERLREKGLLDSNGQPVQRPIGW